MPNGGALAMWCYIFLASIVMVNLLVAMFSDTYTKIKANSEIEYRRQTNSSSPRPDGSPARW